LFNKTPTSYNVECDLLYLNNNQQKSNRLLNFITRIKALKKIKKTLKLDIVISFLDSPNFVNILSKVDGCRTVISVRNYTLYENNNRIIKLINNIFIKILYKKADSVITVSKVINDYYKSVYKIPNQKIQVIYNPYNYDEIYRLSNENIDQEYIDFYKNSFVIVSVGRLMKQKGYWHLIKAFKDSLEIYPDLHLVIIGKEYDGGKVKKLVKDFKLGNNVLLIGEVVNPFKYMKNASMYVSSSIYEGFPNALVEAMLCGLPIISADCKSGPREILDNGDYNKIANQIEYSEYGILIPPLEKNENWDITFRTKSENTLTLAIIDLIKNKDIRLSYSKKSIERAKFFSYDKILNEYKKIIELGA